MNERDTKMLSFIARVGCASKDAVQDLLFGPWGSRAQARLRQAFDHRFLNKLAGRARDEADVYYISPSAKRGWPLVEAALAAEGRRPLPLPHPQQLEETLMMSRLFARLLRAAGDAGLSVAEWRPERELRAVPCLGRVVPDGYIRIRRGLAMEAPGASFFLEFERSDKALAYWGEKFGRYVELYESGRYEEAFGTRSLRILIVLDRSAAGEARLGSLAAVAERKEATMVRLATWGTLRAAPARDVLTSPLWVQPGSERRLALFKIGGSDDE